MENRDYGLIKNGQMAGIKKTGMGMKRRGLLPINP